MRLFEFVVLLVSIVLFAAPTAWAQDDSPFGQWVTDGGLSRVELYACGAELCGRIVWLQEPLEENGTPKVDDKNENEALRSRALMGLNLIVGFVPNGRPGRWKNGTIYNPEDGKTYQCIMRLEDTNTIVVRGYVLLPIFGRTQTWTRYRG